MPDAHHLRWCQLQTNMMSPASDTVLLICVNEDQDLAGVTPKSNKSKIPSLGEEGEDVLQFRFTKSKHSKKSQLF